MHLERRPLPFLGGALALLVFVCNGHAQAESPITWERIKIRGTNPGERFADCALPDLDGDGDLDLALIRKQGLELFNNGRPEDAAPPIETWLNDGSGHFTPVSIHPFATDRWSAVAFDWADVDDDGDDDVVLWGGGPWVEVHPMENRGDHFDYWEFTYAAWPVLWNAGARWIEVDGKPALFVFRGTGDLYVLEDPVCGLSPKPLASTGSRWGALLRDGSEAYEVLDYDSDGDLDVVLAPWSPDDIGLTLLENRSALMEDVTLARLAGHALTIEGGSLVLGDLDGDGLQDLILGDMGPPVDWGSRDEAPDLPDLLFQRTRTGFRPAPVAIVVPFVARSRSCFVADFDVDGRQDILFIGVVNSASYLALNRGDWTFELYPSFGGDLPNLEGDTAAVGDLDGDGRPDVFMAGYSELVVYLNKPTPTSKPR